MAISFEQAHISSEGGAGQPGAKLHHPEMAWLKVCQSSYRLIMLVPKNKRING